MSSNAGKHKTRTARFWQVLVAGKLLLLGTLWVVMNGGFHFGDQEVLAETEGSGKDGAKDAKEAKETKQAKDVKDAGKDGKDSKATEAKPEKTRKSFLSNLLELPELNPDSMKKEELGRYLEIAERKKRQVEERLSGLGRREEQLKNLETSIDEKLKHLDEERRYFAQTIQQEKVLKGERIDKLVTMYAKMEPKKAAPVLEKMDKDLVVELFKQLPQKQITAILEVMTPDKSVALTEYYGRIRSTREYDVLKEKNDSLRKEFDDCKGMPKASAPN